ncbi:MAG: hypothetical protein EXR71_02555 [Myxococcales bacterium]|nr:hypothetical protein [Myxococcales bacterium]
METSPALVLGAFELQAHIATGGIGEVWRAVHTATRVSAAVKLLSEAAARDPVARSALRVELRAAAGLDHPNIVYVYGTGEVGGAVAAQSGGRLAAGTAWIAMEYADGGTLRDRVGTMTWAAVQAALGDVLAGLAHAHARGMVHGDVKPANLLLGGARPGVKLGDFGLVRTAEADRAGLAEGGWGTPGYMAPERVADGFGPVGPWSDLYAFGCTAWALLTGSPPFVGSPEAVMQQHVSASLPAFAPVLPVPGGVESWLRRLLVREPALRLRHAADAARILQRLPDATVPGRQRRMPPRPALPADVTLRVARSWRRRVAADPAEMGSLPAPSLPFPVRPNPPPSIPQVLAGAGLELLGLRSFPVVGRRAEQDFLWASLREVVVSGAARAVLVRGASGVGTSRLSRWLLESAAELGVARPMTAWYGAMAGPARGLRPAFRRALRIPGGQRELTTDAVSAAAPALDASDAAALAAWLSQTGRAGPLPRSERLSLLRRVLRAMAEAPPPTGEGRPLVFWVDGADQGSLDALALVRSLLGAPIPVLFVLALTDELLPARSLEAAMLADLRELPSVAELRVGALGEVSCRLLLTEYVGLDPAVAAAVTRLTAGNPLFALQLLGDCVRRHLLETGPAGVRFTPGAPLELPADLERVWVLRLESAGEGLPAAQAEAVELMAVLGDPVDESDWLAACAEAGLGPAIELVERLETEGLLVRVLGDTAWSFVHAMFREAMVRRAARGGRLDGAHRACAAMLLRRNVRADSERIGRHLGAAGDLGGSLAPLAIAIDERIIARELPAAAELLELRGDALARIGVAMDDARHAEQRFLHALHAQLAGQLQRAEGLLAALISDAGTHGWTGVQARALWLRGRISRRRGDFLASADSFVDAALHAASTGDQRTLGRVHADLGDVLSEAGEWEASRRAFDTALPIFHALDDALGLGEVHMGHALLALRARSAADAEGHLLAALSCYRGTGNRIGQARALNLRGDVLRFSGRPDEAADDYRAAIALLDSVQSWMAVVPQVNLGLLMVEGEQWAPARLHLVAMLQELSRHPFREAELCARLGVLTAALALGEVALCVAQRAPISELLTAAPLRTPEVSRLVAAATSRGRAAGLGELVAWLGDPT